MNHDDPHFPVGDQIIEARIVAWVAGEASPFEVAELTRLLSEKPELMAFKKQIEAVHGLLGEAVGPTAPLQLSPERRAELFSKLGLSAVKLEPMKEAAPSIAPPDTNDPAGHPPKAKPASQLVYPVSAVRRIRWMKGLSIACSGLLTFMILKMTVLTPRTTALYERTSFDQTQKSLDGSKTQSTIEDAEKVAVHNLPSRRKTESTQVELPSSREIENFSAPSSPVASQPEFGNVQREAGFDHYSRASLTDSMSQEVATIQSHTQGVSGPLLKLGDSPQNSILFGTGSPQGLIGTAPQKQEFVSSPLLDDAKSTSGGVVSANSTLAGSLVRTDLKDVGSAISAVTQQFLADTGSATKDQLRDFQASPDTVAAGKAPAPGSYLQNGSWDADQAPAKTAATGSSLNPARTELTTATEPVSTFSLHVSDVSFRLAAASLKRGEQPDPVSIRPEEFYNAFDYGDPAVNLAEQVSCRIEQSAHPELQQRNLVRIAVRVPATGRGAGQPLRLTVLLDTSGSMQRDDRAAAVRRAMQVLVSLLGPADRVTLIGFSRTPRLLAESVRGDQAAALLKIVAQTPAEGGTNLEEALKLAGELARRQQDSSAQNRIVLFTDGAANLGDADPARLAAHVVKFRQEGIAFDACGVGSDNVDDTLLEALTRDGDGRYTLLSDADASVDAFAHQLAGAFRPAAKNVKVQVRFNPARVGHYRLIGFERHRLRTEDFRNDQVDAAELAANEAAIAIYQVEPLPQGEGELGEVFVRFQDAATGNTIERSWTLSYDAHVASFDRATPSMQLAGASTLVAEKLQGDPVRLDVLRGPMNTLRAYYQNEAPVQELVTMYNELRRIEGTK